MLAAILAPIVFFAVFCGVPLTVWAILGCPHVDD